MPWHVFFMKTRGRVSYTLIHALSIRWRILGHMYDRGRFFVEKWYAFVRCCMWGEKLRRRGCICSGGVCICAGGAPLVCLSFVLCGVLFVSFVFVSAVLSRCPCLRGPRLGLASELVFSLFFGFGSLVGGLCSWLFSFPFSLCWLLWVLSMHSSRGRLRTRCVRRPVEGRSLVMSDWQRCVHWCLAKCAGTGCGLTRVGAGEEQAWKALAAAASGWWRGK